MPMTLTGQVAVVTGAGSGIGRAVAEALSRCGARVVVADRDVRSLTQVAGALPGLRPLEMDVRRAADWQRVVHDVVAVEGRIDILCASAGVLTIQRVLDMTEQEWDLVFDVNAKGVFLGSQAVLPTMIAQGSGSIVNVASMAGKKGVALSAHYAASKWAVIGFTRSLAAEVGASGIRVNCVCPAFIRTPMHDLELAREAELLGLSPEAIQDGYIRRTPLGRLGEAKDVADAVSFLCGDQARFLTGVALDVTGGADLP